MRVSMPPHDSIQEFEQAKDDRFWDGAALNLCNHGSGSVYVFGYKVEIALKCAYFRFIKHPIYQSIEKNPDLLKAETRAKALKIPVAKSEAFHSVLFWCELLRAERADKGSAFALAFDAALVHQTRVIYDRWWVDMRYKSRRYTTALDMEAVLAAADWFDRNYDNLWK